MSETPDNMFAGKSDEYLMEMIKDGGMDSAAGRELTRRREANRTRATTTGQFKTVGGLGARLRQAQGEQAQPDTPASEPDKVEPAQADEAASTDETKGGGDIRNKFRTRSGGIGTRTGTYPVVKPDEGDK